MGDRLLSSLAATRALCARVASSAASVRSALTAARCAQCLAAGIGLADETAHATALEAIRLTGNLATHPSSHARMASAQIAERLVHAYRSESSATLRQARALVLVPCAFVRPSAPPAAAPTLLLLLRQAVVGALRNLASSHSFQQQLPALGVVPMLLRSLLCASPHEQEMAAGALRNLLVAEPNKALVSESGGAEALLALLSDAHATPAAHEAAARAMASLALHLPSQHKHAVVASVRPLVALLGSARPSTREAAAKALAHIARKHEANQLAVADAGAAALLIKLVTSDPDAAAVQAAVVALACIAEHVELAPRLIELGAVDVLQQLRNAPSLRRRTAQLAAKALRRLGVDEPLHADVLSGGSSGGEADG